MFHNEHTRCDAHATEQRFEVEVPNFCPACGTALVDRFAFGRSRRFCQSCDRVIFREHKVAAALLLTDGLRVLLIKRRNDPHAGHWSLPAGFVDHDEDPCAAALRECYEETGLEARITGIAGIISGREHARGADFVIVYHGEIIGGTLKAADDAEDAQFFAADVLPPLAFRATTQALQVWIQNKRAE